MEKQVRKLLRNVGNQIHPDIKVIKDADDMVKKINTLLKKYRIDAVCAKGGSIAKETFLKEDYDIDLFIRYNPTYKNKNISDISENIIKELCTVLKTNFDRIHGSRDYFQFRIQKVKKILIFEVIPVILIHSQNYMDAENITDLSPEHVNWVKKYTDKKPGLTDEIRLAKQFCKANSIYGAESYINGFSGHILDILVIHYGSFYDMINAFSKFDENSLNKSIIVDTEKNLKNPLKQLNKSKITPLIIIDPIQKNRNSAAALSKEKLLIFIKATKKFLEKPDKKFFEIQTFDIEKDIANSLSQLGLGNKTTTVKIIRIEMETVDSSKDIAGTKALKAYEAILEHLKLGGFKVLSSKWNFTHDERKAYAYIITGGNISKEIMLEGPPKNSRENYKRFVDKHAAAGHKLLDKESRVYAIAPRKFIDPKSFIEDLSKKEFISRRIKRIFVR